MYHGVRPGLLCCVVCARSQHSARFYPTGVAQRMEPCSHWRRRRQRERKGGVALGTEARSYTHHQPPSPPPPPIRPTGWLTLCFDGTERLYGNTCHGDGLFPFTSSDGRPLWLDSARGMLHRFRRSERRFHTQFSAWFAAISHRFLADRYRPAPDWRTRQQSALFIWRRFTLLLFLFHSLIRSSFHCARCANGNRLKNHKYQTNLLMNFSKRTQI